MNILTDKLTAADLTRATKGDVYADLRPTGSRLRDHGFDVSLYFIGEKVAGDGRRRSNTGTHGAGERYTATWDEHGEWMAALYELDPKLIVYGHYSGRADFHAKTGDKYRLVRFATLDLDDGKPFETNVRTIRQSDIAACPHVIFTPGHYRADGSCRCNDPDAAEMAEWGYEWDGSSWVSPPEDVVA